MLSPEYRITEEESREALRLWLDTDGYNAMSVEERNAVDVLMDAEKLGRWPVTAQDVYDYRDNERQEAERKRVSGWQNEGRITAYDFSCYEKQVADGLDGPFVAFMSVAVELKNSGKENLTVGDVRAEIAKRKQ